MCGFLVRRLHIKVFQKLKSSFFRITISALCAGGLTGAVAFYLYADSSVAIFLGDFTQPLGRVFPAQFTKFTSLTFVYGVLFFFFAVVFKAKDALSLLSGVLPKKRS